MNMQGLQYTLSTKSVARPLCLCDAPEIQLDELQESSPTCDTCGRKVNRSSMKAAKRMLLMKDLHDIKEAKANIRNTLKLQQKRNKERAEELEFLLKRL